MLHIERREWWLWFSAVLVTLLLTLGIVSFALPVLMAHEDVFYSFALRQAVHGLVGLVLLFDIFAIYQQLLLHRIRRNLVEREELFRLISENAADMIAVVDVSGRRLYNSPAYQNVLGYSAEELKISPALEQVHPEDRQRVAEAAEEGLRTGLGRRLEYRMRHKDGTWRILESTASVVRNVKGESAKLVIVNRDITERKRAEAALRNSEAEYRTLVEEAPHGIYRCTREGQLLAVNDALVALLGYASKAELMRMNTHEFYQNPQERARLIEQHWDSGRLEVVEVEWKRKNGQALTVRLNGWGLRDASGAVVNFVIFAENVTDRRVLEQQLRQAQKMEAIGRLSGGVAHDFNNLLGVIIGYSEVLEQCLDQRGPLRKHAEEIKKAGQRAASLTRQLLAFSRQQVLELNVFDLNAVVSDMEKMLRRLIGEDVELTTVLDPALGRIKADQGQLEQVIMNLAVNARDAMPRGGKLILETANVELDEAYTRQHPGSRPGSYVMLSVTDSGVGMDAETQTHIFEPFFTTKERGKGTGLGLATVYGVIKQSGGYIWVDSQVGQGASFKIYLPRIAEPVVSSDPGEPRVGALRGSETVLVVEDEEPLRKLAGQLLGSADYTVLEASSGAEAIQVAEQHHGPIQLLLTDVVMPDMNGRVLAEQLVLLHPDIKVLYMSGYTDSVIAEHGVLKPNTHLLHKPFTRETLMRKVREVLTAGEPGKPAVSASPALVGDHRAKKPS